ncbi:MAG: SDR family NAD(P)-dependent oxidoreductase [Microbacter sp.]
MNKTALIVGATKGIGRALTERFLHEGFSVVGTYAHDREHAEQLSAELNRLFEHRLQFIQAGSTDMQSIEWVASFIESQHLSLDVVIFNAGMTDRSPFSEIEVQHWMDVFTVNIHFPVFLLQRLFPLINYGGSVLFTGSLMALHPHSFSLSYGVTKAAVHALVKNLVKFLNEKMIRVNAVAPGFVDTEWQKNKPDELRNNIIRKIAVHRFCDPKELTDVYWLLVNNNYMNGEIVVCDGGYDFS